MEFGQYQLQIFVSLVVILGAAFVALICDFLKGNNEQLRELTIELKVRREEEQRRAHVLTAQPMSAPAARSQKDLAQNDPEPRIAEAKIEAAPRAMAAPKDRKERKRNASADAIAAMERGAAMASNPRMRGSRPAVPVELPATQAEPAVAIQVQPQSANGKKDWKSLLDRRAPEKNSMEVRNDLMEAVAAATINQRKQDAAADFPAGFHDGFVLSQLVQSRKPVSGLVVSIGVNAPRNSDGSLPENVRGLMQSLIGPDDFACQSSEEEFLLIYPGEGGASAQRRLSQIAQQLWDFQLRSLGEFSILFSWGGVEVRSESIDEAIASANERMQETRRGRKLLTMEPRLKQAV